VSQNPSVQGPEACRRVNIDLAKSDKTNKLQLQSNEALLPKHGSKVLLVWPYLKAVQAQAE